jgi:hypothetical protein
VVKRPRAQSWSREGETRARLGSLDQHQRRYRRGHPPA